MAAATNATSPTNRLTIAVPSMSPSDIGARGNHIVNEPIAHDRGTFKTILTPGSRPQEWNCCNIAKSWKCDAIVSTSPKSLQSPTFFPAQCAAWVILVTGLIRRAG